jgi:hypothetical protein
MKIDLVANEDNTSLPITHIGNVSLFEAVTSILDGSVSAREAIYNEM